MMGTSGDIHEIACTNCGAALQFSPGTSNLVCQHCGTGNEIATESTTSVIENDYHSFLATSRTDALPQEQLHTVACTACGATTTLKPNVTSDQCPFCATPLVIKNQKTLSCIKPQYLLPFSVKKEKAHSLFTVWVAKRWFAPNDLKRSATHVDSLNGLYIPYWTYDTKTDSDYTGERGTNHTESYSITENGKRVMRTRTVIRWRRVSGHIHKFFDDVLVIASTSLPEKYAMRLEPWDLANLTKFNESFLAGFRTETYRIDLSAGFEKAKIIMDTKIRELIKRDIGGDHQRISSVHTSWDGITFKHILLPIWLSAYRHNGKVYRFMVNGRTGEVQGERPWSMIKITLAAVAGISALAAAWYFLHPYFQ